MVWDWLRQLLTVGGRFTEFVAAVMKGASSKVPAHGIELARISVDVLSCEKRSVEMRGGSWTKRLDKVGRISTAAFISVCSNAITCQRRLC